MDKKFNTINDVIDYLINAANDIKQQNFQTLVWTIIAAISFLLILIVLIIYIVIAIKYLIEKGREKRIEKRKKKEEKKLKDLDEKKKKCEQREASWNQLLRERKEMRVFFEDDEGNLVK